MTWVCLAARGAEYFAVIESIMSCVYSVLEGKSGVI